MSAARPVTGESLALTGGVVTELRWAEDGLQLDARTVVIENGRIARLLLPGEPHGAAREIDCAGAFVFAGLCCSHLRSPRALLPGLPFRGKGETERARAARYLAGLDGDSLSAAARGAAAEAALAGTTLVYDLLECPRVEGAIERVAAAYAEVGLRAVLALDLSGLGMDEARGALAGLARAGRTLDPDRIRLGVGIGDPSESPWIAEAVAEARRAELPMHIVLGGDEESRRRIAERGAYRPGSVVVVRAALADEERALLRDLGVWIATTPRADAAEGIVPPSLRGVLARTTLGGWMGRADLWVERQVAFAARRAVDPAFDRIHSWGMVVRAWDLAASTFGAPFGRFQPGAPADVTVVDAPGSSPMTAPSLGGHLERMSDRHVRHVVVAGKPVVLDGRLARADERAIRAAAADQTRRLWSRAAVA